MIPRSSQSFSHDESLLRERTIQQEENGSSTTTSDNESNLQHQQQRSSPIAIIGRQRQQSQSQQQSGGGDGGTNNNIAAMNDDDSTDLDDDDDDNNNNDVDVVERDAKQLQRKYGGVTMVQTYQPPSSVFLTTHPTRQQHQQQQQTRTTTTSTTSLALNAPYLGSRHRSPNQVLSLPPMSLAGDTNAGDCCNEEEEEEPPESIGGTFFAYGSLRDSHERGRFLDGPSSYREPTSGKIRQLDHRLRYHGTGSSHHQLSIGERMQQSRKLKEIRQKMEQKQKQQKEGMKGQGLDYDQNQSTTTATQQQSSLSAMMNEASKQQTLSSRDETVVVADTILSLGEEMTLMPSITDDMPTFFDLDQQEQQQERDFRVETPYMLSTSMTALEMLRMSNISSNFNVMSLNPSLMSSSRQQQLHQHPPTSLSTTTTATIPGAVLSSVTTTTTAATQNVVPGSDADHHQHSFQPLARSMSDPTPRWQQPQVFLRNHAIKPTPTIAAAGNVWTTTTTTVAHHPHHHSISPGLVPSQHDDNDNNNNQQQPPSPSYGYAVAPQQPDHDPDTDGAFGDLDME